MADDARDAVAMGFVAPADTGAVRELDAAGVDSLWVGGHIASRNPSPEPLVWLARLAEQSSAPMIGTAALLLPLYPPALLAKQLADIDRQTGGRIALGVGVGGEYDSDFAAVQVPTQGRGSRADEVIGLLRRFWTAEPVTHAGKHFHFDEVRIHPAPARAGGPPLLVCGRSDAAMRRASRLGDGWMPYLYSARRYGQSVANIRERAAADGRDLESFGWYVYLMVSVDDDPARARQYALKSFGGLYRQDFDAFVDRVAVVGDLETVTARMQEYVDAGADHLVVCLFVADRVAMAHRMRQEVLPRLRSPRPTTVLEVR